ncbi:hypothetical protein MUNTM_21200 [Mycobacterium sp. MUNTM1]
MVNAIAPQLTAAFGTAAEMLIVAGDNPDRIRTEAAWAKLCGVCPIPASMAKPFATGSTGVGTAKLTRRSTAPSSCECNTINPPRPTWRDAPPKASPRPKSSGA